MYLITGVKIGLNQKENNDSVYYLPKVNIIKETLWIKWCRF
jgi:hypothetical protein